LAREWVLSRLFPGEWISGQEMAKSLGVSRAAVWKQVQILRAKGFEIESCTHRGYRLKSSPDLLESALIRSGLCTKTIGCKVNCFEEVDSTNHVARSLARSCPDGTVFLAESQTEGRGRLARSWHSPPGGVWMSIFLRPALPLAQAYRINMAVAVALARAVSNLYGLSARIKWPNDILIGERKLCGILMEISAEVDRIEYAVVGVGLNANIDVSCFPIEWRSTSLSQELGHEVSRIELIQKILQEVDDIYGSMAFEDLYHEWCSRSATLGKMVRITSGSGDLVGQAVKLAEDGALTLSTDEGYMRVLAGDCIHLREV
jgi:BirA family biotin operon repressor/biotin-[acetyl-CoA-carboxylase] ligase